MDGRAAGSPPSPRDRRGSSASGSRTRTATAIFSPAASSRRTPSTCCISKRWNHAVPWLALRSDFGERDVDLLNADISEVIRAAASATTGVEIRGAEETTSQRRARRGRGAPAGGTNSIYRNVARELRAGPGATRRSSARCTAPAGRGGCSRSSGRRGSPLAGDERLNLAVMSVRKDLLTPRVRALPALTRSRRRGSRAGRYRGRWTLGVHDWFLHLTRRFLDYRTVVLFTRPHAVSAAMPRYDAANSPRSLCRCTVPRPDSPVSRRSGCRNAAIPRRPSGKSGNRCRTRRPVSKCAGLRLGCPAGKRRPARMLAGMATTATATQWGRAPGGHVV